MPLSIQELEAEALKLDLPTRAALVERLLYSLEDLTDSENEQLWVTEACRRKEELESGRAIARDGEAVLQEAESSQ